ncbi:TetR family transcriptional regulator [Gammaproteobacteria bacterium 42_54_T18]|nr:TetR family transcriptional regulator [Gammaproteobacteria bacterium 42_54_T18]
MVTGIMGTKANSLLAGMEDTPRGRILAAAAHLFQKKGFERATVRDLAQAVGMQSGSIFHHFKTKEEILRNVMIEVIRFNTERMEQELKNAKDIRGKVLALMKSELQSVNGETGEAMAVLIYEWRSLKPESQQEILELREVYEQMWLNVFDDAKEAGLIEEDVDTFILRRFITGALGWSNFWYKPGGALDISALAEKSLSLVLKGKC